MKPILALAFLVFLGTLSPSRLVAQSGSEPVTTAIVRPIPWRMTSRGWQDGSTWIRDSRRYDGPVERIHPVLLSVNIALGALFFLIWFAPEEQVDRLLGRPSRQPKKTDSR